jgi:hypothetical protein
LQNKIKIKDLERENIEDLLYVCSSKRLNDLVHRKGMDLKRSWLHKMLDRYGSVVKIAYYGNKPVAQILYYPETADPTKTAGRDDVLTLACVYNPTSAAQKLGIGTKLLKSVIDDAKLGRTCLGNRRCRFIVAKAFNTGELLSLSEFFKKNKFLQAPEEGVMYLPIEGEYASALPVGEYEPLQEDLDRAIVFYSPICQFSYQFATKTVELIKEVAPAIPVELINQWERPEESIKRKNSDPIVNARHIKTFFMDTERFKEEVKRVICKKT